jgi:hypothetical protein
MSSHGLRRFVVVLILLLPAGPPAFAEAALSPQSAAAVHAVPGSVVLADSWGIGRLFSGGGRTRVVQVSVVAMCIALFIMMRKFNG